MIRRIMQVEIELPGELDGLGASECAVVIRDPRTGEVICSLLGELEDWVPNE